jgi:heptosyltransferase-2
LRNNLIIRSSYSQLSNRELKSNLGDLIRSTALTNCIKGNYFWLTEKKAVPLLKWFVDPGKIITYEDLDYFPPDLEIYNADNYVPNKEVFNSLKGNWHGYIWDGNKILTDNEIIRNTEAYTAGNYKGSWQQALVEGMEFTWKEQDYAISSIRTEETVDVGLNWNVHPDWKTKHWPKENWDELMKTLSNNYSVSWQEGLNDYDKYMNWISSCRVIVTVETLGLHLASALRKKVVAITGPTTDNEYSYNRITSVKPDSRECMPCNAPACKTGEWCLSEISVESISKIVDSILGQETSEKSC